MTLKERWKAAESDIGLILKNVMGKGLLLCSALGAANEYLELVPTDFVPQWLKVTIVVCGVIGFVAGKMTVKPKPC